MTGAPWTPAPGAIVFLPEETQGFTEAEAYAFLMGGAPTPTGLVAAADVHNGAMIALIPSSSDLARLALPDGEPVEQLHVTIFFLGPADDINEETQQTIIDAMKDLAQRLPVIEAEVFSFSVFNPARPDACLVAGLSGSDLEDAYDSVEEFLGETGFEPPEQHEPWIPHCTLIYDEDPERLLTHELMMQAGPVTLDKIRVAFGGVVTDIPLGAAVVASDAFHLAGKHDQKTHGHASTVSLKEQQDFHKRLGKAKSGSKAHKSTASTDAFGGKGDDGYGEAGADTVRGFPSAVGEYQTSGFSTNGHLRDGTANLSVGAGGEVTASGVIVPAFDGAFDRKRSHLKDDISVERGVRDPHKLWGNDWSPNGDNSGLTWDDAGFVSTTTSSSVAHHFATRETGSPVIMKMLVPKGTPALSVGKNGSHPDYDWENEVVLPRGMRFRIIADHGVDADGIRRVDVDVVGRVADGLTAAADVVTPPEKPIKFGKLPKDSPFIDIGPPVKIHRFALMEQIDGEYTAPDLEDGVTAADVFHLAGKHNQQSHAHGSAPLEQVSGRQLKKQRKSYDEKIGGASTGFAGGHDSVDSGDADVQDAMSHYAGSVGYYDINTGLREAHGNVDEVVVPPRRNITGNASPYDDNETLRTDISTLHRGMAESHTPHDIIAHRVVSNPGVALGSHYSRDGDNSGLTWREHGFTSTTTGGKDHIDDQKIRLRGGIDNRQTPTMTMRILVPAGSHALAGRRQEAEVVLDSGSVFRIINDHGIDPAWNTHNVDVELISQ